MLLYIALVSLRPTSAGPPPIASNKCQGARMMMRQTFPSRASPFLPPQVGPLGDVMRYETLWKHGVHMEWILWSNYIKLICEDHFGQTLTLDLAGIVQGKPWCRSSWKSHGSHRPAPLKPGKENHGKENHGQSTAWIRSENCFFLQLPSQEERFPKQTISKRPTNPSELTESTDAVSFFSFFRCSLNFVVFLPIPMLPKLLEHFAAQEATQLWYVHHWRAQECLTFFTFDVSSAQTPPARKCNETGRRQTFWMKHPQAQHPRRLQLLESKSKPSSVPCPQWHDGITPRASLDDAQGLWCKTRLRSWGKMHQRKHQSKLQRNWVPLYPTWLLTW